MARIMRRLHLACLAVTLSITACSGSRDADPSDRTVSDVVKGQAGELACMENMFRQNTVALGKGDETPEYVAAAREIESEGCPPDIAQLWTDHLKAMEDKLAAKAAAVDLERDKTLERIKNDEATCRLLDCWATPISDIADAERRLETKIAGASVRTKETWRDLKHAAAGYHAKVPDEGG